MLFEAGHAFRHVMVREYTSTGVVMVHVTHAEFRLESHSAREELDKLSQDVFMVGLCRVVNEHYTICVLLDSGPVLLAAEFARTVPEFKIDFTECRHAWWRASFEVNNSIIISKILIIINSKCYYYLPAADSRSIKLRRPLLEFS